MADYWVSFRLKRDATYDDRYEALTDEIEGCGTGGYWAETSSFYLVDSSLNLDGLMSRLTNTVNGRKDLLLVRRLDTKAAYYFGPLEAEPTLRAFMPYAERWV